jgi:hypothetical protein
MKLQENIRKILKEETNPKEISKFIRRRVSSEELEKFFIEAFNYAYDLNKKRRILSANAISEIVSTTISVLISGDLYWKFKNTTSEHSEWVVDVKNNLNDYYKDRIIKMYKERNNINESVKEESLKNSLIDDIKTEGWFNVSQYVGGDEELKKITEIHNSYQFMKLFLNITPKQSDERPEMILYKNEMGVNLFIHVFNNNLNEYMVYFNGDITYRPLQFFLETRPLGERNEFLNKWLRKNYKINVVDRNIVWFDPKEDSYLTYLN